MSLRALLLIAVLAATLTAPVRAGEMIVQGRVLDVQPLAGQAGRAAGRCGQADPPAGAGLVALLRWDLRHGCAAGRDAERYRVVYRWDGRTYTRTMDEHPGDTVTLKVRVR